jgi:predicted RNase H-like HicB family nuclease
MRKDMPMKRTFSASIVREGEWYVAQCLEVDIASQGETEAEALANLREALELYFEEPQATAMPRVEKFEVELGAA